MRKLTVAVMCCTALASVVSSANAAVTDIGTVTPADPSGDTLAAMEAQCDAKAVAHGPTWSGALDEANIFASYVSGPTEIGTEADRVIDESTRVGAGTFTPAHLEILGDPYRNGGSVNMFGVQQSVGGHYSNSAYDFTADFKSTYSFAFNCTMTETVHIPVQGHYVIDVDFNGNEEQGQQSCNSFTAMGPTWPQWGADHAQCDWVLDAAAHDEVQARPDEAGTPVLQDQTDNLSAHETFGAGFDTDETLLIGQVVVCISPSTTTKKLPGAWTAKNGYTGDKCTTEWYNGGAKVGVPNLNDGSHNWVTIPVA